MSKTGSELRLKEITHTYTSRTGTSGGSTIMVIPIKIARKYGIDKPAHVVVEEAQDGILIKKLDLDREENSR
jgi:hypothetical protein